MKLGRREVIGLGAAALVAGTGHTARAAGKKWDDKDTPLILSVAEGIPFTSSALSGLKGMTLILTGFDAHQSDGGFTQDQTVSKIEARLRGAKLKVFSRVEDDTALRCALLSLELSEIPAGDGSKIYTADLYVSEPVMLLHIPARMGLARIYSDGFFGLSQTGTLPAEFATGLDSVLDRFLNQYAKDNP